MSRVSRPPRERPERLHCRGWEPSLPDPRLNQQPDPLAPTGSFLRGATPEQVFDLVGNLLEWTHDPRPLLMGRHCVDVRENGEGCAYATMLHGPQHHDFTTGFRCCQVPGTAAPTRGGSGAPTRSFDDPRAPLPASPPSVKYASADAPCPLDMVLVDGDRCVGVRQNCLPWADPPGGCSAAHWGGVREPDAVRGAEVQDAILHRSARVHRAGRGAAPDARVNVRPFGVQSLVGNADEWCVRPGAVPRSVLRGGWWLTGRNRCRAVTDSHGESHAGPQTGFRCCKASR